MGPLRETKRPQDHRQSWRRAWTAFILGATATLLDVGADIYEERIRLQDLIRREVTTITEAIESAESTNTQLAQHIRHNPSTSSVHLQKLGTALISKHPIVASVHIAPNGIVQQHYPSHATELNGRNLLTHPLSKDLSLSALKNEQTVVGLQNNIGDDAQSLIIRTPINDRNNAPGRGFIDTHISLKALNANFLHDSRITTKKLKLEIRNKTKHNKQRDQLSSINPLTARVETSLPYSQEIIILSGETNLKWPLQGHLLSHSLVFFGVSGSAFIIMTWLNRKNQLQLELLQGIEEQTQLAQAAFDQSADAILAINPESGDILAANEASVELFGVNSQDKLLKLTTLDLSREHQPDGLLSQQRLKTLTSEALQNGTIDYEWLYKRLDNNKTWLGAAYTRRIAVQNKQLLLTRIRDISQERRKQEELTNLAYRDSLTLLANRTSALNWLKKLLRNKNDASLALIHLDIDSFQSINDIFGNETGDKILINTGTILRDLCDESDLIARLESDAFLAIIKGFSKEQALQWTELAQNKITNEIGSNKNIPARITISAGITTHAETTTHSAEQLLEQANTALSIARSRGDQQVQVYSESIGESVQRRLSLERELEEAIKDNFKSFSLVYQAQISSGGQLHSAEALLRWQLKDGTAVAPLEFIPVAERSGHIQQLTRWVIDQSCQQLKAWQATPQAIQKLSINVSARHFETTAGQEALEADLNRAIKKHDLRPEMLELEITETAFLQNNIQTLNSIHNLSKQGFPLAIDDFGTGFASHQLLKQVPASKLKIDKEFVDGINETQEDNAIIEASILIAKRLGLTTVAEGVESENQVNTLIGMGCDHFQGYFFSAPLPPRECERRYWS